MPTDAADQTFARDLGRTRAVGPARAPPVRRVGRARQPGAPIRARLAAQVPSGPPPVGCGVRVSQGRRFARGPRLATDRPSDRTSRRGAPASRVAALLRPPGLPEDPLGVAAELRRAPRVARSGPPRVVMSDSGAGRFATKIAHDEHVRQPPLAVRRFRRACTRPTRQRGRRVLQEDSLGLVLPTVQLLLGFGRPSTPPRPPADRSRQTTSSRAGPRSSSAPR